MCGRDYLLNEPNEVAEFLNEGKIPAVNLVKDKLQQINIPPTSEILTLLNKEGKYVLEKTNWGIKFREKSPLIINSKIETIKEKDYWFNLFNHNRALVPMTGFYEWPVIKGKKVMHQVFLKKSPLFFAAALWTKIKDKTCTSIITVPGNEFMTKGKVYVHPRMPVIILRNQVKEYFDNPPEKDLDMCIPYPGKDMAMERAKV